MRISVPGKPVPQGSKRHIGHGVMVEMGVGLKEWRSDIKMTAIHAGWMPEPGPVQLELDFFFIRPKHHFGTGRNAGIVKESSPAFPTRPDIDKLCRAVLDALTGVAFNDDAQVAVLRATKGYALNPGVVVEVTPL